jgi:hypothetical protein
MTLEARAETADQAGARASREEHVMSTGDRDDVRRAREMLMSLEERRLGLSERVMRGDRNALEEDRGLERRLRELARWLMSAEQQEEEERHTETERRGEELKEAWRRRHPEEDR